MKTQHQKIIEMCKDNDWHCQREFWRNYIFSPHKRRAEIEKQGVYSFEERPCIHGTTSSKDFKMIELDNAEKENRTSKTAGQSGQPTDSLPLQETLQMSIMRNAFAGRPSLFQEIRKQSA